MGTNVYALKKNPRTLVRWKDLEVALAAKDPWSLREIVEEWKAAEETNRVHIGKRSSGWKFLFNHNNWKYYSYTKESITKFLESCYALEDEYGRLIEVQEFWKDFGEVNPTGWDLETYYRDHDELNAFCAKDAIYSPFGTIPKDLPWRFSESTDFG